MIADSARGAAKAAELLRRAQDDRLSAAEARRAGAALASFYLANGRVNEAPLDELTMEAYRGFDARVAAVQSKAGLRRRR